MPTPEVREMTAYELKQALVDAEEEPEYDEEV